MASIVHYLDNFIAIITISAGSFQEVLTTFNNTYIHLTDALGIPRNDSKDAAGTLIVVLGVKIDTTLLQARIPHDKLACTASEAALLLQPVRVSYKALQCIIGFLQHCTKVVRLGRAHLQALYSNLSSFLPHQHAVCCLSHDSRDDLAWWRDTLPFFNGIYLFDKSRPLIALYTDAYNLGLGLFFFHISSQDYTQD